jgi:sugar lactone lactonase YvrE
VCTTPTGEDVGCIFLTRERDWVVAALRSGWHWLHLASGRSQLISKPEQSQSCRFNDGAVDARGRIWTGTLEDGEARPVGALYRLDPDLHSHTMAEGFLCSNGIDWSTDGEWLFFVDSRRDAIFRYRYDVDTGSIGERELFVDTSTFAGLPDGIAVDAEGLLWCAFWDGSALRAFAPDGKPVVKIPVPAIRPTSLCFGGTDMKTIFVTSATVGLSESELSESPASGSTFAIQSQTAGRPAGVFSGQVPL